MPRLENWSLIGGRFLSGKVYGHPLIEDGTEVITSLIKKLDLENRQVRTHNTDYELGEARKTNERKRRSQ